jgi:hypothetical protein
LNDQPYLKAFRRVLKLFSANDVGDDGRTMERNLVELENSEVVRILNVKFNGSPYQDFAVRIYSYTSSGVWI